MSTSKKHEPCVNEKNIILSSRFSIIRSSKT